MEPAEHRIISPPDRQTKVAFSEMHHALFLNPGVTLHRSQPLHLGQREQTKTGHPGLHQPLLTKSRFVGKFFG